MLRSFLLIAWMSLLIGLTALGTNKLLKRSLRIPLSILETFAVIIPLAVGYLSYSYLILATLGRLVPATVVTVAALPLILFIFLPETRERIRREKKLPLNSLFRLLRKLGTFFFKKEIWEFFGLALIIVGLTLLIDPGIYHYALKKADFYWFDPWRYWQLSRRVAATGKLPGPNVFDFYSHAIECFLASVFLPINMVQPTIDATKFFGIMMFFLEIVGVFTLVQVCLNSRVSRSIAFTGGIVAMSFYISAPLVVYHSLLVVHETQSIPLLFSLLIISAKIEKHTNKAYQSLLIIYVSLFWATGVLTLLIVSLTMGFRRVSLFFRRGKPQQTKMLARRLQIRGHMGAWKTRFLVAFFVLYPLLSIMNSLNEIYYDIDRSILSYQGSNGGNYIRNKRIFGVIGFFDIGNILANSLGLIGTGVIIFFGILLPRYWKYLEFRKSVKSTLQFIFGIYYLVLTLGLLWNVLPLHIFMPQLRLSLYVALAGSIIAGVSTGCFIRFAKIRIAATKNNYLRFSLLKNAKKVIVVIILIQTIYGISLSSQVYMWEDESSYHDLIQISNDSSIGTGTIFCLEPDLVHMIEGVLFPKFEIIFEPFLVWENPSVTLYSPLELDRYVQLLKNNNITLFIIRRATWNTTRQIYEETRLKILMDAWHSKWKPAQIELWAKSWDDRWAEIPNFKKFEYKQLLIVMM